jgi:tetratricopeptide (TPR) repeat protein
MKMSLILLLAGAGTGAAHLAPSPAAKTAGSLQPQAVSTNTAASTSSSKPRQVARLAGFAPELADMQRIAGPKGWSGMTRRQAIGKLAVAERDTRQRARWDYAVSLIADDRFADALGVLDVMLQDDPDLALVANFELARGAVYAALERPKEALAALDSDQLAGNAEACFWRATAFARSGLSAEALRAAACARPALTDRSKPQRASFLIKMAEAAITNNQPAAALRWLSVAPDTDPAANIARGRALVALKDFGRARIALGRAERGGDEAQRYEARLALIDMGVTSGTMNVKEARREVDQIRYVWRGGSIEKQALLLSYRLSKKAGDVRGAVSAGATLIRYFELGVDLPPLVAEVQAQLAALLAPNSRMALADVAGLYWDYRDLVPAGGEGDRMTGQLAQRLQANGLYARAAELLEYQLRHRALDVEQGPLSVQVASLHILAGRPDRALAAINDTARTIFPQPMVWDRAKIEAVALYQAGKTDEALAVLDGVPGAGGLRAELSWKRRDWNRLVTESTPELPSSGALSEVEQAVVLRYAIALALLGREGELAQLRTRYQGGFASLPTAPVFDMLTRDAGSVDPEAIAQAMSAIPSASPAGTYADLLEAAPSSPRRR